MSIEPESAYERSLQAIASARGSSEIHGLLERIAFYYHTKQPYASKETNWNYAQQRLAQWWSSLVSSYWKIEQTLPDELRYLADKISKRNRRIAQFYPELKDDPVRNWLMVLDMYAQSAINFTQPPICID